MRRAALIAVAAAGLLPATVAGAAKLTVGSGVTADLGTASLDLGCGDLTVEGMLMVSGGAIKQARDVTTMAGGTLQGGSGSIELAGDWSNTGTFNAGTSTVSFMDGCSVVSATISGSNTFSSLGLSTTSGKTFSFAAGSTQTITNSLSLTGAPANLLALRSTVGGSEAFLDLQGSHDPITFTDVMDLHASGNPISAGPGSRNSGNTDGWFFGAVVPALPWVGLAALALALWWAGRSRLRPLRAA